MKLRLTLTLDIARVHDDEPPTTPDVERESTLDGTLVDFGESSPRRRTEYPFGFTPHPEDDNP